MVCLVNAKADRPGLTAGWVEMIDAVPCRGRRFSLEVTHSTRTHYANSGVAYTTRPPAAVERRALLYGCPGVKLS
jgi:hypothetical protein